MQGPCVDLLRLPAEPEDVLVGDAVEEELLDAVLHQRHQGSAQVLQNGTHERLVQGQGLEFPDAFDSA